MYIQGIQKNLEIFKSGNSDVKEWKKVYINIVRKMVRKRALEYFPVLHCEEEGYSF